MDIRLDYFMDYIIIGLIRGELWISRLISFNIKLYILIIGKYKKILDLENSWIFKFYLFLGKIKYFLYFKIWKKYNLIFDYSSL